jgi:hypothetical protein
MTAQLGSRGTGQAGLPTWWASLAVRSAALPLPSEHRWRYRQEFLAELYGMTPTEQRHHDPQGGWYRECRDCGTQREGYGGGVGGIGGHDTPGCGIARARLAGPGPSRPAAGEGSLGRGMQASGDWANLPTATGPIAAVPCPRLQELGSRRDGPQSAGLVAGGLSQETAGVQ